MRFWRRVIALVSLVGWSLRGLGRIFLYMLQNPSDARWAIRAARSVERNLTLPANLEWVGPCLMRPSTRDEEASAPSQNAPSRAPVVLYFTGTGETPEALAASFQRLRRGVPALANATEYVVMAPNNKGAYYGSNQFASRMWEAVAPLAAHYPGPFVLVGFSRGALVALEIATRIAEEHAKVASVLALSPPLLVPKQLPLPVVTVARFEQVVEGLQAATRELPSWIANHTERVVRSSFILLTAMVLKNLGVLAREELLLAVQAVNGRGAFESSLQASREFRLLLEAKSRDADLFTEGLARSIAQSRRLFAALLWGSDDTWVETKACVARATYLLRKEPDARSRFLLDTAQGQGHALFRASGADQEPSLRCLARVADEANQRAAFEEQRSAQTDIMIRASENP